MANDDGSNNGTTLAHSLQNICRDDREALDLLDELLKNELGCSFQTFEEFCQASMPYGLGRSVEKIDREIEVRKLRQHGGDHKSREYQPSDQKVDHYGETREYLLSRLGRDHPDILEAFRQGQYRSVRAAAIDARAGRNI